MRWTRNCNDCSLHWSTEWAQFFSMTMSDHTLHNQRFESWTNWTMKFCLIFHIHLTSQQLTTTSSSISTTFFRENAFTTIRKQKILFKGSLNPKTWIFMLQNKQTFLIGKNVLIVMVPILINKDVLEPRYNDLKFTVQNCNYFSSTSRYSINPWMQPRQPCSILAPFSGNDYLQKQGIEIQGKAYLLGISPYHFSFCTDFTTHGRHIPKSSDLRSSVDFGFCILWLHQLSMAMKTLFRQATPAWLGYLTSCVTPVSPQCLWAHIPHLNLSSTSRGIRNKGIHLLDQRMLEEMMFII